MFFTGDTHFGSKKHLELCKRPFTSTKQMNSAIILNWNRVVNRDDIVYVLGDFGNYETIKRLNGKVILICGNYEKQDMKNMGLSFYEFRKLLIEKGFYDVHEEFLNIKIDGIDKDVKLIHEPSKNNSNMFNLYSHVHKTHLVKKFGLNVGVDLHNYCPIDSNEIIFYKNAIDNHYDDEVFIN